MAEEVIKDEEVIEKKEEEKPEETPEEKPEEETVEIEKSDESVEKEVAEKTDESGESTVEEEDKTTEEVEKEVEGSDPWDDWSDIFPEMKEEVVKEKILSAEDVKRIVREEIKNWVKGIKEGKYPMPTSGGKEEEPTKYPYPEKALKKIATESFKKISDEINDLKKSRDDLKKEIDTFTKSLDAMQKEVEVIRDTPIDIVEKSMKEDIAYTPKIRINPFDRSITKR